MKKNWYIIITVIIILIVSRFLIRIFDATVQIKNLFLILCLIILLLLVNFFISHISCKIYKKQKSKKTFK